jgi:hypothetical protein
MMIIVTFYSPWGPHRPIRLCNSCLEWLDDVLAPPNLFLALNVHVKLFLAQTMAPLQLGSYTCRWTDR